MVLPGCPSPSAFLRKAQSCPLLPCLVGSWGSDVWRQGSGCYNCAKLQRRGYPFYDLLPTECCHLSAVASRAHHCLWTGGREGKRRKRNTRAVVGGDNGSGERNTIKLLKGQVVCWERKEKDRCFFFLCFFFP